MTIQESVLTESRSLRAQYADRTDVLEKVKALQMLPDNTHLDTRMVAGYYEVSQSTIESLVAANKDELESNGRTVLAGAELREFATPFGGVAKLIGPKARSLAIFSKRALLNVGQLLKDSPVARAVRTEQLNSSTGSGSGEMSKAEWIRQALEIEEQRELLVLENAKLRVKAEAFDLWINGKGCYLVGTVAKMVGIGPNALWEFLYAEKILIKAPGAKRHREPYARPELDGWFEVKGVEAKRANGHDAQTTYFLPYGAERIRLRLIKRGLLPAEQLAVINGGQDALFGELQ